MTRFCNSRVRLVRTRGGKHFGGWLIGANEKVLVVELTSDEQLSPGEPVNFRAISADCQAELHTVHLATQGRRAAFAVPKLIRFERSVEHPRYRSRDSHVSLVGTQGAIRAKDVDISSNGFGLRSSAPMDVGERAQIVFQSPGFDATFDVECAHCCGEGHGFHLGFRIVSMDRTLNVRWSRYVASLVREAA